MRRRRTRGRPARPARGSARRRAAPRPQAGTRRRCDIDGRNRRQASAAPRASGDPRRARRPSRRRRRARSAPKAAHPRASGDDQRRDREPGEQRASTAIGARRRHASGAEEQRHRESGIRPPRSFNPAGDRTPRARRRRSAPGKRRVSPSVDAVSNRHVATVLRRRIRASSRQMIAGPRFIPGMMRKLPLGDDAAPAPLASIRRRAEGGDADQDLSPDRSGLRRRVPRGVVRGGAAADLRLGLAGLVLFVPFLAYVCSLLRSVEAGDRWLTQPRSGQGSWA